MIMDHSAKPKNKVNRINKIFCNSIGFFLYALQINSGRYNKKEDFTVVIQPFIKLFNAPLDKNRQYEEVIDISYVTYDCFHFSQKGHALGMYKRSPYYRKLTSKIFYFFFHPHKINFCENPNRDSTLQDISKTVLILQNAI